MNRSKSRMTTDVDLPNEVVPIKTKTLNRLFSLRTSKGLTRGDLQTISHFMEANWELIDEALKEAYEAGQES